MSLKQKKCGLNEEVKSSHEQSSSGQKPKASGVHRPDPKVTKQEIEIILEKVIQLVNKSPEKASVIITEWMKKIK